MSFGGALSWLTASRRYEAAVSHRRRVARQRGAGRASRGRDVTHLPRGLLPARALVLALSPLLDARGIGALLDLRARGYDLAVIEISPVALTPADSAGSGRLPLASGACSATHYAPAFETLGVPVVIWKYPRTSLELAIEEVTTFRRHARPAPRA